MAKRIQNKKKIFNDPVYGFITIPHPLIFDIIEHPWFQRLRRIKQLGLTHLVFPGALHTRFHHSLGAMHLTEQALSVLKSKGHEISIEEKISTLIAILLHDMGHGPFSHALEDSLVNDFKHEDISVLLMKKLQSELQSNLSISISIFNQTYQRSFFSQMISSQLDMDRLDYLSRDSFFTGVSEGIIGTERIIKMLEVSDDQLVVEKKGIYSLEKYLIARRLMYWQVYMHKTVLSAENMLIKILKRAKELAFNGVELPATPALNFFLTQYIDKKQFIENPSVIHHFTNLDDFDIVSSIKQWVNHEDKVLSILCKMILNRRLFRCEIQTEQFEYFYLEEVKEKIRKKLDLNEDQIDYFVINNTTSNFAYQVGGKDILIKQKDNRIVNFSEVADNLNIPALSKPVTKYFLCYPKN